ncbi:MAG: metal ABC transporter permease [Chloroflexi bacterium]|nr:metal ABC transporter permease [Chloroflexota bacterium]MBP8057533.1 metal ABC transporter permease [Chloroflexota bacterium]
MNWLLDPLQYNFILRGLLASLLVGLVCPVIGAYIVLRGMSFLGDALAHAILPGVVVAFFLGWPLSWGALLAGVITAVAIGLVTEQGQVKEDTAIGVLFSGMFALGIALLSTQRDYSVDLTHILFGNLLGVSVNDLIISTVLGTVVLLTILVFYKEFLVIAFDPLLAVTLRLPVRFFRYLLLVLLAVTIVVALQTVGVSLMLAMLVTPAAAAYQLTNRLHWMMMLAAAIGVFSGISGLYLSYYANIASGPAVVLIATLIFILVFLFAPGKGVVWRYGWGARTRGKSQSERG